MGFGQHWFALCTICAVLIRTLASAAGHEFWIEPTDFSVPEGRRIEADLKVGQHLSGLSFPYLSNRFSSFKLSEGGLTSDLSGEEGSIPALGIISKSAGLKVITYVSTADQLTYTALEQFVSYAELEGNSWAVEAHKQRGLPETGFVELYTRCAKALVQVGPVNPSDNDIAIGMPIEFVALKNPYALKAATDLPVVLLWSGKPVPNAQITVFHKTDNVTETRLRTDATGRASIPLNGGGLFLLSSVYLQEPPRASKAQWESYWASLTFEIAVAENP